MGEVSQAEFVEILNLVPPDLFVPVPPADPSPPPAIPGPPPPTPRITFRNILPPNPELPNAPLLMTPKKKEGLGYSDATLMADIEHSARGYIPFANVFGQKRFISKLMDCVLECSICNSSTSCYSYSVTCPNNHVVCR